MQLFGDGLAVLLALAIIFIGLRYVSNPMAMAPSFGLTPPEPGVATAWLRLKGVRDIASGLTVLAFLTLGPPRGVGLILLVEAVIPIGDMLVVLGGGGSRKTAFGVHGLTAIVMVLTASALLTGGA